MTLYVGLAVAWVYAVVANDDWRARVGPGIEFSVLPLVYLLLGAALASWWALLLPVVTIAIALPAGENPAISGDLDWVFFDPLSMLPYALVASALGVFVGRRVGRPEDARGGPSQLER